MKIRLYSLFLLLILLIDSCSSGKAAYKQGDYYEAVLAAVQRLRGKPDHKKSREVLKLSYQLAVDYLETDDANKLSQLRYVAAGLTAAAVLVSARPLMGVSAWCWTAVNASTA